MALVRITLTCCECGKEFEHRHTCRNTSDAANYEAWARDNVTICPECYRAALRVAEEKQAAENATSAGLPALEGTEKQVRYALVLRERLIDRTPMLRRMVKGLSIELGKGAKLDVIAAAVNNAESAGQNVKLQKMAVQIMATTSAAWYIEHQR